VGIHVPDYEHFDDLNKAKKFVQKTGKDMSLNLLHLRAERAGVRQQLTSLKQRMIYLDTLISLEVSAAASNSYSKKLYKGLRLVPKRIFNGEDSFLSMVRLKKRNS